VQIQANYLYLIAQFLNSATNHRKDEYGGSTVNRARFLFEITETVLEHLEPGRVGIKIGPMNIPSLTPGYRPRDGIEVGPVKTPGPFAANADTLPDMEYVIKRLNGYKLAHLLLMGANTDFTGSPLEQLAGDGMFRHFRPLFHGHLIANVEMTQERGNRLIKTGLADSIAFGRHYIANPDLPERFATGAPLADLDWQTVYASGAKGYIDYPALEPEAIGAGTSRKTL